MSPAKLKLLVVELWGLGDLVIATPFLRAASERYAVTLVAKPYAQELQTRLWPGVRVVSFVAPWTAFQGKYRLGRWPWREMWQLWRRLRPERFEVGASARWGDPRDHFWLWIAGARRRLGFPRLGSQRFLTQSLSRPEPAAHRYEYWRMLGTALDLEMPEREAIPFPPRRAANTVLVHSGAGRPVRVWPLDRFHGIVRHLRSTGRRVLVACDPAQTEWWRRTGESEVATPRTVNELLVLIDQAGVFIGNDSGPGHLAAFCGVPTFTIFGPQVPDWFVPLHPQTECVEGKACPFKPCSDYCRFAEPRCLAGISEQQIVEQVTASRLFAL